MNITPLKPENIDVSKISFSDPKMLDSGAKHLWINHERSPIYVQTPEFDIPFDTGTFYEEKPGTGKFAIKVSLNGYDSDPKIKKFHDMLEKLDEHLINSATENSPKWFKKKLSKEVTQELYTTMLRISKDEDGEPNGRYPPSFAFKINKRDGQVLCKVYDSDQKEVNVNNPPSDGETDSDFLDLEKAFKKNTKVKMLLKCNGIWIASGKFGYTWRAEQIRIKVPASFDNYAFIPSDDEDNDEGGGASTSSTEPKPKELIESSDESESEDEEVVVKKTPKTSKTSKGSRKD